MSVTLIATVVALVLGHLAPSLAGAVRQYGWYGDWVRWLNRQFGDGTAWRGQWGIALALLPPQNATGNFVKIVQRLPVRIDLVDYNPEEAPLFVTQ